MKRKQLAGFSALLLTAAMFTACADETDTAVEAGSDLDTQKRDSTSIGLMQIGGAVPVEYGITEGIFEKRGLEVDYAFTRGGSVMVPAVQTGEYDFAITNPLTIDRKSTRLNSSHVAISYAVFCSKKKKTHHR